MKKIVILDAYTENPGDLSWKEIEKLGDLKIYDRTDVDNNYEIISRIADCEIVITNKTPITKNIIDACPSIKFICMLSTGYNIVDVAYAREKGIGASNVPSYGTEAVAQFCFSLILEICNHVGEHNLSVHNGDWENSKDFCYWNYPLIELKDKTLGIIGLGKIGKEVAKIAKAMSMNVIAYSPRQNEKGAKLANYVSLDEVFKNSDIISLHCPLFKETKEIINKSNISKMKDGVIIINNSRGGLINEKDLAYALNSGKVLAAGLDVVSTEPIKHNNPLLTAKNCIITPHISWASKECRQRIMDTTTKNIISYLKGHPINLVN